MFSLLSPLDLVVIALTLLFVQAVRERRRRKGLPYPPGPRGLSIIGNLFDAPRERPWLTYAEWAKKYGDILSLKVAGQVVVVVQSTRAIRDLLDNRRATYSDRPVVTFYERAGWDWMLPMARADEEWRVGRRAVDRGLRPAAAVQFQPMQKAKTHDFLKRLLRRPEHFLEHIEHLQGAIVMSLAYGYDIKEHNDVFLDAAKEVGQLFNTALFPEALLSNSLPMLWSLPEWLPGMGFKKLARNGRELGQQVIRRPLTFMKESIENGTARPSMALDDLRDCSSEDHERMIAAALASIHTAGADTTVSVLTSFFLMLVLYPSIQERAQSELDSVLRGETLPDYSDRPRLPYIDAICKELIRWRVVGPLGLPHATTEDDVYDGYFIPEGSTVIANSWAILHDPSTYPDPEVFKPERFLTIDGQVKDDPLLSAVFGFGKRICPGRHVVDSTLYIVVAAVLATFTVSKTKDSQGHEIPVDGDDYVGDVLKQSSREVLAPNALQTQTGPVRELMLYGFSFSATLLTLHRQPDHLI
ncbi:cytochrome P450 [Artomyces pyxidatus]|uniref:Cytochrome P450 n=1 Tax=Artomyces pyxidatus TaxID=48021 RepID=A0ACB8SZ09_9AGAM|nr:cytochrome P450 [Artomyces pyxidatus]